MAITQQQQNYYQTKNGITLTDGFYFAANIQKKYISIILIKNKENMVMIFNTPARMTIQQFLQLETMGGTEIIEKIEYPKKVLKYRFK